MAFSLRSTMLATAALAAILTIAVSVIPSAFAYMAPEGHVALDTAGGLVSLLVGYLVLGRFLQTGQLSDLILAGALGTIGFTNLAFAAIPAAAGSPFTHWTTWAPLGGRLLGAFGFAAAAVVGDQRLRNPREAIAPFIVMLAGVLTLIGVGFAFAAPSLPLGIDPSLSPNSSGHPRIVGNTVVLAVQAISMVLFAIAAVGFYRRAERTRDGLLGWFAVGCVLYAFASLNYFLFPSLYSQWVYSGDFLRAAFFVVLLVGAASEIQRYQQGLAAAAAFEERRRLARELHDGLAQELAFIATQTRWLSRRIKDSDNVDQLVVAAERALDESRSAISALTRPMDEPLDAAVAQAAEEVAGRVGIRVKLELEEGIAVAPSTREALVRIVREAVSNTARHGKASVATVALTARDGVTLRVSDDGIGFDPTERDGRGFGLTSMRERARALGGDLRVTSQPDGGGTQVEVVLP